MGRPSKYTDEFRREATAELERRGLGAFAEGVEEVAHSKVLEPESVDAPSGAIRRQWLGLPESGRRAMVYSALLVVVTIGTGWGTSTPFAHLLALNAWIAGVFVLAFATHALAARRVANEGVCWGLAFAVLMGLGRAGELLVV